jgi:hypothetical protein
MGLLLRSVRTSFGQSGSLRGLELVPAKSETLLHLLKKFMSKLREFTVGHKETRR